MDEETKKPEKEQPAVDTGEGDKPQTSTLVDDTNLAAKRLEDATREAKEERIAAEESYAKRKLGGVTEAGQAQEKKPETDEEYTERFDKGEVNPMKENVE